MAQYTLLFVDDEPNVIDLLRVTFSDRTDYEVLTASGGREALQILASRPVDLLVSDQRMPGMTGIELVSKAREAQPDLCAILLTAYTDPRDLVAAINQAGVYRYLTKPWDTPDLILTVERALEQVQLRRDKARLVDELKRRLAALQVAVDVARDGAAVSSFDGLVEGLLARLPQLVPCDFAAALVVQEGGPANLVMARYAEAGEDALIKLKEGALTAWREAQGSPVSEGTLRVRIVPSPTSNRQAGAPRARMMLPLQIKGRLAGQLTLVSGQNEAFGGDDARVLDLLANELSESVRVLTDKLSEERRRIERVLDCMADGVVVVDSRNEQVIANPAARQMLRAPEGDPVTLGWLSETLGFKPYDLVRGWEYSGATPRADELQLQGKTLWSVVSPVTDPQGKLTGVAVVLRDVTEQRDLETRKEEFVHVVSHELRSPLTAITGALDLLLGPLASPMGEKQARYLKMARESTERLNAIVDDLLDLAKLAKGKMPMAFDVTHLGEVAAKAIESFTPAAAEKRIQLRATLPEEPVKLVADASRLTQVLGNLLTNAVKFTPEGGRVEVSLFQPAVVSGWVGISVWNDGEAIAEDDLERIFEKFEQARTERNRTVKGTGLGLAICRSIVESHGGRIWAESAPGQGARFVVLLPTAPPKEASEPAPPPAPGAPPPPTVVVVDDDPSVVYVMKALLMGRRIRCLTARTADEALALARRLRPKLVCIDIRMPEIDGLRLAGILRHDPDTRRIPVLAVSSPEERDRAFRAGVSAFLGKPFEAGQFVALTESLIRGERAVRRKVLVVDDDTAVRSVCAEVLGAIGYEVLEAGTCADAKRIIQEGRPDLVLLDVQLPDGDGFTFLESIKEERAAGHIGVVFLTAHGQTRDKVRGFRLGADDYLVKPFDALELGARIDAVTRRREVELANSPTTRLPGGRSIEREVEERLEARKPFALCYLDLDNFKSFNDHYGYAKADGVIQQTGDLLRSVLGKDEGTFLGHIAGDDFVFLVPYERVDDVCRRVIKAFDQVIPLYYDREDRERGYLEGDDRYGERRRFPIISASVVAVMCPPGRFTRHSDLARVAAELKKRAKAISGSCYLRDDSADVEAVRSA
jgi:signal transduction histidine kinase/CheY-like chemotaxis protein/GGDEF domain-containing protein